MAPSLMTAFDSSADRQPGTWIDGNGTAVFVPEGYEPGYAYPLVVWLEDSRGSGQAARDWFPRASERNCIVISLQPPLPADSLERDAEWRFSADDLWEALDYVGTAIAEVSAEMNVHPDRIFLAGDGDGATMACDLLCVDPDQFAGAIAFRPSGPHADGVLHDWRSTPSRSVLLLAETLDADRRLPLEQAGLDVEWSADLAPSAISSRLIAWIMGHISTATPA